MRAALASRDRPLLNLALFAATLITTFDAYLELIRGPGRTSSTHQELVAAVTFSASLLLILGAHEMGHYWLAKRHGVDTSLPYFIPLPYVGMGTLGAVIRIRSRIPSRNALVDIGAAGPILGLVVAVPVIILGFRLSHVVTVAAGTSTGWNPLSLWALSSRLLDTLQAWHAHRPLPDWGFVGNISFGDSLLMLGLQRLVVGPLGPHQDVLAHPLLISGWFGLLVTMLNLVPIGQLDGGHVTHALFGRRAETLGKVMALILLGLCLFATVTWVVWLLLCSLAIGFRHPPVIAPEEPLSASRKTVGLVCLVLLVLCFMPIPMGVGAP